MALPLAIGKHTAATRFFGVYLSQTTVFAWLVSRGADRTYFSTSAPRVWRPPLLPAHQGSMLLLGSGCPSLGAWL
jgi:hypothetical protein